MIRCWQVPYGTPHTTTCSCGHLLEMHVRKTAFGSTEAICVECLEAKVSQLEVAVLAVPPLPADVSKVTCYECQRVFESADVRELHEMVAHG